jgi:hypothetical protein
MVMLTPDSALVRVNVFDTPSTSSTGLIVSSWSESPVRFAYDWRCQSFRN